MKLAVVGVGHAGSRIANRVLEVENETGRNLSRGNALTVNTARPEFDVSEHVPDDRQLLIGDTHRGVNGEGVDGDPDLAAEVTREERSEIRRALDAIDFADVDGVLVVAGLGGGTGSGAGAVVIDDLKSICDKPVYALGVLPSPDEGPEPALNAARALRSMVPTADNLIAFDNDSWNSGEGPDGRDYELTNRELATRVVTLFAAGEFDRPSVAETKMDPSDIMRTLDTGGISSIGYASTDVPGRGGGIGAWLRKLPFVPDAHDDEDDGTDAAKINKLVRRAVHSQLTLPCAVSSAERALIVLSGPSRELSRKGFESGRYWLEQEADTVEVLAGDEPHEEASELSAVVLLSNVTEVDRIEAIQALAVGSGDDEGADLGDVDRDDEDDEDDDIDEEPPTVENESDD